MKENIKLRQANPKDRESLCDVQRSAILTLGLSHYSEAQVEAWAGVVTPEGYDKTIGNDYVVVAEEGFQVMGFGRLESNGEIGGIYVRPAFVRRGIASAILSDLLSEARRSGFRVVRCESSLCAEAFYGHEGFKSGQKYVRRFRNGREMECVSMTKELDAREAEQVQVRMPRPIPTFRGQLVTLRPPDPVADAGDYYEINRDPEMHMWTGNHVLQSVAEAQVELEKFAAMEDISQWMIVDNPTGRVVGRFFLCLEDRDGVRVVGEGNRIAKAFWRKGHNREARALLFLYIFGELQADRIETGAWEGNVNSLKSIESYGFQPDHEEQKWNEKHGQMMVMRYYVLTKAQWNNGHSQHRILRAPHTERVGSLNK